MSQKNLSDGGQKGFTVGRGLLAAAETLNFSINEQRSGPQSRTLGSMVSSLGVGDGGGESMDPNSQMSRHSGGAGGGGGGSGGGNHLGNTMKLFASLGQSPADLDALAQIPEEDISVETLPQILMQLKNRKGEAGDRRMAGNPRDLPSLSSESSYQGGRDDWGDMRGERLGGSSMGQASARAPPQANYAYDSMQDASPARGYNLDYGSNNGGTGNRDRQYSDLSRRDSYGGVGMGPPQSDNVFMQRRMGSPSQGKVQDFLGAMPPMFPHVCSLCDFDVHSTMEWNQHTNGLRHAENRRVLVKMYPDWDPSMAQNRGGGARRMDMPNLSAGLLGPAPLSQGQTAGGMSSNWGGGASSSFSNKNQFHSPMHPKMRSRVVVAKYDRKPNNNKALFAFTEPFGTLREHLVLKTKAFLEMDTHQEAVDMVNYYQQNPARMFGKNVIFYLSKELLVIEKEDRPGERANREVKGQGSQVVFFSNLPREQDEQMELLTVAGRFGLVEKHLFLTSKAFVQLGTPEDAEMMVKYYNQNPLIIKGRTIRLNICTKYKTLNVSRRGGYGASTGDNRGRWSSEPTPANKNYANRAVDKSSASKSSSSKSTASSKEKKKPEEKQVAEGESDEEEEEVAGVMEGDDEAAEGKEECEVEQEPDVEEPQPGTSAPDEDEEGSEKPPADSSHAAEAPQEPGGIPTGDDSTTEDKDANGAKDEDNQLAETKKPSEPTESSTEEPETREETAADPAESAGMTERELPEDLEGTVDQDFMENMDDFVTLDELAEDEDDLHTKDSDSFDSTKEGGMRVVNILGFRRGYNFLEELLALAKPFGKVVKHLVLDLKSEAYLQFATEDEAKAMSRFYNRNITASVCGKPVKICHSQTYPTIQCGDSKVVYIGQLPHSKYTDESVLKLAEPFGQVKKYFVNRVRRECFIEMENSKDAEKIAEAYKFSPPKLQGRRQTVLVSRKYKQLKYGHRRVQLEERKASKRDASSSSSQDKSSKHPEETPAKRSKEETTPAEEEEAVEREQEEESAEVSSGEQEAAAEPMETAAEPMETQSEDPEPGESDQPGEQDPAVDVKREEVEDVSADQNQNRPAEEPTPAETKPAAASLPLTPYEQNNPVGVEYVRTGFYCRVCFLFYSNEETAKKVHCSSQAHYDKVKKHLEKEQAKAQNKKEEKNLE